MKLIKDAITEWFGERCPDFDEGCFACQAWAEWDAMTKEIADLKASNERLADALAAAKVRAGDTW